MGRVLVGDAVGAGFGLIRRQPTTVLIWGGIRVALVAGTLALMAPFYSLLFSQVAAGPKAGGALSTEMMASMMQMQGVSYLASFLGMFVNVVLYCAVFRAVLRPDESRFAYLRIGTAELMIFVLFIGLYIAAFFAIFVVAILGAIVVGVLVVTHAAVVGVIVGIMTFVAFTVGSAYVALRFILVGPMMVDEGQFRLFEAWTLTKGSTVRLLVIGLELGAIVLLAQIVLAVIFVSLGLAMVSSAAGGMANLPAYFRQPPSTWLDSLTPLLIAGGLIWVPLTGAFMAIMGAPWARAYRDLVGPDLAATFS